MVRSSQKVATRSMNKKKKINNKPYDRGTVGLETMIYRESPAQKGRILIIHRIEGDTNTVFLIVIAQSQW